MPVVTIAAVVEGHGEVRALPGLLHRIALEMSVYSLRVPAPMRIGRGSLTAAGGIERAVSAMAARVAGPGGVLVLLDADDDCPATLGPNLLARARAVRPDVSVSVVLANREYETWLIAAATSLSGRHGFPADLAAPADPEKIRGAKEWLGERRENGRPYKPTVDQAPLTAAFDLELARANSPSFDKFCRDARVLLADGREPGAAP